MILLDTNISGIPDTLIAATALVFDLELLTYNRNVESAQRFSVYTHFTSKQWIWINSPPAAQFAYFVALQGPRTIFYKPQALSDSQQTTPNL